MRTVLIGPEPGRSHVEPFHPAGASGRYLAQLLGISNEEFRNRFDRVNLRLKIGESEDEDRLGIDNLLPLLRGRRVVAVGRRVSTKMMEDPKLWTWRLENGCTITSMPHPSQRSLWWNKYANRIMAERQMKSWLKPCIHVEGVDGSGKSTLVESLAKEMELEIVETQDPPIDLGECRSRVEQRIRPGIICDRSSGLISELVYGPVLRDGVLGNYEDYWSMVKSIQYAVTFIYCRPPFDYLSVSFRTEETKKHVRAVNKNLKALYAQYDVVMSKLSALGARVVVYDWTSKSVWGLPSPV